MAKVFFLPALDMGYLPQTAVIKVNDWVEHYIGRMILRPWRFGRKPLSWGNVKNAGI